jgi:hypothetical protein
MNTEHKQAPPTADASGHAKGNGVHSDVPPHLPAAGAEPAFDASAKPIWEEIEEIMAQLPPDELARLPVDGAENHDHYIYGTARRTA